MGVQRDEDFITEFIFVKLYNRSEAFRDIIAKKFGSNVKISNEIEFTGSKNKKDPKYGCPDATGKDEKLYIEVKTKMNTPLTDFEKKDGALYVNVKGAFKRAAKCTSHETKGNRNPNGFDYYGYKKYLDENPEGKLLYVVCNENYDLKNACKGKKGQVGYLYWTEILDFVKKTNSDDDLIKIIESRVEGLQDVEEENSVIDITTKLCRFSAVLIQNKIINSIDQSIAQAYDEILESDCIWFGWDGRLIGFENINRISLVISIQTGDVCLYLCDNAYQNKTKIIQKKFNLKKVKTKYDDDDNQLYLKIFSINDYESFETNSELIKALTKYLDNIKKIFTNNKNLV